MPTHIAYHREGEPNASRQIPYLLVEEDLKDWKDRLTSSEFETLKKIVTRT